MSNGVYDLSPFTGYEWMVGTSCSYRRILTSSGEPVIIPVNARSDGHPDLQATDEDLTLAASAPQLLISTLELLECMAPAASDFSDHEQEVFDRAISTVQALGGDLLLERFVG